MTLSWVAAPPRGTVYTYTIVRRAPSEEFRDRAPYVVALVDLDAGPRLMGNVVGAGAEEIQIGARVAVAFDLAGGTPVPTFTPEALT
jgi:uncharacterized OB-fold protein